MILRHNLAQRLHEPRPMHRIPIGHVSGNRRHRHTHITAQRMIIVGVHVQQRQSCLHRRRGSIAFQFARIAGQLLRLFTLTRLDNQQFRFAQQRRSGQQLLDAFDLHGDRIARVNVALESVRQNADDQRIEIRATGRRPTDLRFGLAG